MSTIRYKEETEITVSKELKLFVRSIAASYRYIFQQVDRYDLVRRADMLELIEMDRVADLASRFATIPENTKLTLTKSEVYLFFTMMELVCRSFLCEIGDDYKAIAMKMNKVDETRYNEVRSTELLIAQALIQQIRKDFQADPDFEELVDLLEMLDN
ncbi:hypothetical protein BH11BAC2_BH11BAC2_20550 [soil metagenome]